MQSPSRPDLVAGGRGLVRVAGALVAALLLVDAAAILLAVAGKGLAVLTGAGRPFHGHSWILVGLGWTAVTALAVVAWRRRPHRRVAGAAVPGVGAVVGGAQPTEPDTGSTELVNDGRDDAAPGARVRWGDRRRWASGAGEAALVATATFVVLGHGPWMLASRWLGDIDTKYYGWMAWRLAHDGPSLRLHGVMHPGGLEVPLLDGLLPIGLSGLLVRLFGRYLGFNLVVLAGLAGNYLAARHLARTLGADRTVRIVAGLAYLASPVFLGPASSFPSLLWGFAPPLLLAQALRAARGRSPLAWPLVAATLVGAYLCSVYHLVFGLLAAVVVGLVWPRSALRTRRNAIHGLAGIAVALVVLSPFVAARLAYVREERDAGAAAEAMVDDAIGLSADAIEAATLPPDARFVPLDVRWGVDERPLELFRTAAVGWALLAGLGLVLVRRARGAGALAAAAGVVWLASLGPVLHWAGDRYGPEGGLGSWLPYRAVLAVPGLGALRAPYRASEALAAVLVAALALGLAAGHGDGTWTRRGAVAGTGLLVAVACWPAIPTSRLVVSEPLAATFRSIASTPGDETMTVAPFTCGFDQLDAMNWQTLHDHPMVLCGVSQSASRWYTRLGPWFTSPGFAALSCTPETTVLGRPSRFDAGLQLDAAGVADLRATLGVRWVVYDRSLVAGCRTAGATAAALAPFAVLADDGRYVVYDLAVPA